MEMKLASPGLHQHVLNTLYQDKRTGWLCDAVLRVGELSYHCHVAIIASSSLLLHSALSDLQVENTNELVTIVLAGWTAEEAELFMKQTYNQLDLSPPEADQLVKVESILSFKENVDTKYEPYDENTEGFTGPGLDDYNSDLDLDNIQSLEAPSPGVSNKPKLSKFRNKKKKGSSASSKLTEDSGSGVCQYCNKYYKHLRPHHLDKHLDIIREKENINSIYPQDCPFCGKFLLNRRFKGRHKCFKMSKTTVDYRLTRTPAGRERLEKMINEEVEERVNECQIKEETEFICHLCGIHCPSKSSLSNHLQMNCGNVCDICKEVLANKTEVKEHMFLVHKKIKTSFHNSNTELNFTCTQCPKRYATIHTLNNHIKKTHNQEVSKVQCGDCGNLFSSGAALRKHASLHRPPELPCPICGKLFHNKTYLMRHANSVHAEAEDKKYKCEVCGKGFTNKHALEGHHNWHYNLKPFQCRWCERNYQNQSNCNAHERKSHKTEYQATLTKGNRRIQVEPGKEKYISSQIQM